MATTYKITDKDIKKIWLVISKDYFVGSDNLKIITNICKKNGVAEDSISIFNAGELNLDQIKDLSQTVSFFGARLIVVKDLDITKLNQQDITTLQEIISESQGTHFALIFTCEDEKALNAKKYQPLISLAKQEGLYHFVKDIDVKYLEEMLISHAKKNDTILGKDISRLIVQNIGKNIGLLIQETDKYCSACGYTNITKEIVDEIGCKSIEASVFDIVDLICSKKPLKAIEKLNNLFRLNEDEIAILGALSSSFVDIHRCKLAYIKGMPYTAVHADFEKSSHPFRYQKSMNNSKAFSMENLNEILKLILKTDISLKSTSIDKKQLLSILVTQIIAKGFA